MGCSQCSSKIAPRGHTCGIWNGPCGGWIPQPREQEQDLSCKENSMPFCGGSCEEVTLTSVNMRSALTEGWEGWGQLTGSGQWPVGFLWSVTNHTSKVNYCGILICWDLILNYVSRCVQTYVAPFIIAFFFFFAKQKHTKHIILCVIFLQSTFCISLCKLIHVDQFHSL